MHDPRAGGASRSVMDQKSVPSFLILQSAMGLAVKALGHGWSKLEENRLPLQRPSIMLEPFCPVRPGVVLYFLKGTCAAASSSSKEALTSRAVFLVGR